MSQLPSEEGVFEPARRLPCKFVATATFFWYFRGLPVVSDGRSDARNRSNYCTARH